MTVESPIIRKASIAHPLRLKEYSERRDGKILRGRGVGTAVRGTEVKRTEGRR